MVINAVKTTHEFCKAGPQLLFSCLKICHAEFLLVCVGHNFLHQLSNALQVLRHLVRQRQVAGIKAFNLLHTGACVYSRIEDVDFAMKQDDPHPNRGLAQAITTAI